jgi:hypothetical protein
VSCVKKHLSKLIALGALAAGLATALIATTIAATAASGYFDVNASGQTYGSGYVENPDQPYVPDLILAEGRDGSIGYVYRSDLEGGGPLDKPSTPEEAIGYMDNVRALAQNQLDAGAEYLYMIPLYEANGETVIGEFPVGNPSDILSDP